MKVKSATVSLCRRMLYESLTTDMMVRVVQLVEPEYDIYDRSGIPENIPITNQMAAERIVADVIKDGRFLAFVEALIRIDSVGFMGRPYPMKGLREIIKVVTAEGFVLDRSTGLFFENSSERASPDWGRLMDGEERQAAVLRLDIVGNSTIVKKYPKQDVNKAYTALRNLINRAVVGRLGRIWSWEGDGTIAAFVFGPRERSAVLAGMEILNSLFFYNRLDNPLGEPLRVRLAAHSGPVIYRSNTMELLKNETLKEAVAMEIDGTPSDTLSASPNLFISIDRVIQECFGPEKAVGGTKVRHYAINLEKP